MIKRFLITLTLSAPAALLAQPLNVEGHLYAEACAKIEWLRLQKELNLIANGRSGDQLSKIAYAYLCRKGSSINKELLRHAPKKMWSSAEGSGQEPAHELVDSSDALMPQAGNVWDAEVSAVDDKIKISFRSDEACMKSISFMHRAGAWLFVAIEETCD